MGSRYAFLYKYIRKYWGELLNILTASLFVTAIGINWPYLYKIIVDDVFVLRSYEMGIFVLILYVAMFVVEKFMQYLWRCSDAVLATDFLDEIRKELYGKFFSMKEEERSKITSGELADIIENDTYSLFQFLTIDGIHTLISGLRFLLSILYILYLNKQIGLFICIIIPLTYVLGILIDKRVKPYFEKLKRETDSVYSWLFDIFAGSYTVKLLRAAAYFEKQLEQRMEAIADLRTKSEKAVNRIDQIRLFINLLCDVVVYDISAWFIYQKRMQVGDFVALMVYYNWAKAFFERMAGFFLNKNRHSLAIDRLKGFLEKEDETGGSLAFINGDIELRHVNFGYGDRQILKDFSIRLEAGKCTALVGNSGCGKSTVFHLITHIYEDYTGSILIGGRDLREISLSSLRNNLSIIRQNPVIFDRSVRFNLTLNRPGFGEAELWQVLRLVELEELIAGQEGKLEAGTSFQLISQGQAQRLALARALLFAKSILILDEATSNIDEKMEARIMKRIREQYPGITILLVTYRKASLESTDQVYFLEKGRIITDHEKKSTNWCQNEWRHTSG